MKEIETERLILRNFTESDFEDLFEYISDPAVTEYEPYKPMNKQEARDNLTWRCSTDEMIAARFSALQRRRLHKCFQGSDNRRGM